MLPAPFQYLRPETLAEACSLLQEHGEEAKVLSGGQSLIPMLKLRLFRPAVLVDINRIAGLDYLRIDEEGCMRIGALIREDELESSELVRTRYPILEDTCRLIADPQVRSLATVAGNLAHGDPANDHPATMLALGASVVAAGPDGERVIPIDQFFVGLYQTALQEGEILQEILIPRPPARGGGAYLKLERKVGDFAIAGVAVQLSLAEDGRCEQVGIGLTNVGMTAVRARKAEEFLRGKKLDETALQEAGELAAQEAQPNTDTRGPAEYKRAMVKEFTRRAIGKALQRAGQRGNGNG